MSSGHPRPPSGSPAAPKVALRDQLLTARRRRRLVEVGDAGRAIAAHLLAAPEVRRCATVACYVSVGTEPGTGVLLDELRAAGKRVILPVLLPDNDLDWSAYTGRDSLRSAGRGLMEPTGPALGVEAIATADAVLVPGLAASRAGVRMGRGGGSYDRALARVPINTFTCVLLYDDELLADVPSEPHDRAVAAAATPGGVVRFGGFEARR